MANIPRCLPATLPWSSPYRHNGVKELPTIPVELYVMIFDHMKPLRQETTVDEYKATLGALCLACRMFCAECQPRLFRSYCDNIQSTDMQLAKGRELWHDMLKAKDPRSETLASFVREAKYLTLLPTHGSLLRLRLVALIHRSISIAAASFVSLETLTLRRGILTSQVFLAFSHMPHLKTVTLDSCTGEAPEVDVVHPQQSKWASLTTTFSHNLEPYIPILVEFVDIENLVYFSSDEWLLTTALLKDRTAPSLTELDIAILTQQTPAVPTILQNTPNLTRLSIDVDEWLVREPIPADVIPHLTALITDDVVVSSFLPNHTDVTYLDIAYPHRYNSPPNPFENIGKSSTAAVRELVIAAAHLPCLQVDRFPQLRMLTIVPRCMHPMGAGQPTIFTDAERFLQQNPLPSPTTIVYNMHTSCGSRCRSARTTLKLRDQRAELIPSIAAAFPNARCIRVGEVVEWHPVQGMNGVKAWKPRLLSRLLVRQLLLGDDQWRCRVKGVQDVDGCLASVLREEELAKVRETVGFEDGVPQDVGST